MLVILRGLNRNFSEFAGKAREVVIEETLLVVVIFRLYYFALFIKM